MEPNTAEDPRKARAIRLVREMSKRTTESGCTEAEAMEAAVKIGALLQQFDLELTAILARDMTDMVTRDVYASDFAMSQVITGIGKLCSLVVYSMTGQTSVSTYRMYGHAPDAELGAYLYEVCAEACEVGWVAQMNRPKSQGGGYSKAKQVSFRLGFGGRVGQRMAELRAERDAAAAARAALNPTGTNLVVLKDQLVEAEFEKTGVRLRTRPGPRVHDRAAFHAGARHGDTVNLSNPLGYGSARAGYLT